MKPTSPFSPSLRLWKPWKTATCAHPFFLSGFLPIQRKVSIFYPENVQLPWWAEGSVSIWQRKVNSAQAVLSSKKTPKRNIKEAQHHFNGVMLGFFWLQRFSAGEAMCCLQIALSHFAVWCGNVLFRKILRTEAYRVHSIALCVLIYFFAQE